MVAPVYNVSPADPAFAKQGNTPAGIPAGTQSYDGDLLAGARFTAQLFGGNTNLANTNLAAITPATAFRTDEEGAGFVVAPDFAVQVAGVPEGQPAKIQLRAWDNRDGTITNWGQVLADPAIARGESPAFISPPLGGIFTPPPNPVGLEGFQLHVPAAFFRFLPPSTSDFETNGFRVRFLAQAGGDYSIEATTNLMTWTSLGMAMNVSSNLFEFFDADLNQVRRLYRGRRLLN